MNHSYNHGLTIENRTTFLNYYEDTQMAKAKPMKKDKDGDMDGSKKKKEKC